MPVALRISSRALTFAVALFSLGCSDSAALPSGSGGSGALPGGAAGAAGAAAGGASGGGVGGALTAGASGGGVGGAGAGAGAGGVGGAPPVPVVPVMRDGHWVLELGEVTLEVDPALGARITTFKLGGENLLTGPEVHATYWGSTLWTSPEAQWTHPPPAAIDSAPYTAEAGPASVTMTGSTDQALGVSVTKIFSADPARGSFVMEYRLTNQKQEPLQMAAWEVTRVFPRGLTFFPTGSQQRLSAGATLPTTDSGGITWYAYDTAAVSADSKLFADGAEGWIAHAAAGLLFIKKFPDVAPAEIAPNEGDVELYTNQQHSYIEIENQAAYRTIAPGMSASWKVEWFLRRLPAGVQVTAGSAALAQLVRETIR